MIAEGDEFKLVEATIAVNEAQLDRMMGKIERALSGELQGRTVGVLGLSFKPNTDDVRESRSMEICSRLLKAGATVRVHDPVALDQAMAELPDMTAAADAYDACQGADLIVLATEWNQYRMLDLERLRSVVARPSFLDLRNVYAPEAMEAAGFAYEGIGRGGRIA